MDTRTDTGADTSTGLLDLRAACDLLAAVVRGVRDDQLTLPTPCEGTSVAALLDHVDGLTQAFTAAARKEPVPGGGAPSADAGDLQPGWRDRVPARLDELAEAWRDPAAHEGSTMAGPVELPAPEAALVALDEVVVHGWDLARATGQAYDVDGHAAAACLAFVGSFEPPAEADPGGLFGPPVPVPAGAPLLDRLLGATGRDPGWSA